MPGKVSVAKDPLEKSSNIGGGKIIFRHRETASPYLGRFDLQAVDIIPDTVAGRTRLEPDRLLFASLWGNIWIKRLISFLRFLKIAAGF